MPQLANAALPARDVLVDASSRIKPKTVDRLRDWQYMERSIHRLLAGWGRCHSDWGDKSAVHRHVWEQACVVDRLRQRIAEFPGGKPDAPVSSKLEELGNAVLLAPTFEDALDGIYLMLGFSLVKAYARHVESAHPVHDAPTIVLLHEINMLKEQQFLWYRDYRRRHPHRTEPAYESKVRELIAECSGFLEAVEIAGEPAAPIGATNDFRPACIPGLPCPANAGRQVLPFTKADYTESIEARRLFWALGYFNEKTLPDDQLNWIYFTPDMPWEFHYDVSRHLWDESRHGDSGLSRLKDFGIALEEVGYPLSVPEGVTPGVTPGTKMTLKDVYDCVYFIGMCAETSHFNVKNEAYGEFRNGKDFESAEMMLFDIIDETAHVQYAHRWLPVLAEHAGVDNSDYRERAVKDRARYQAEAAKACEEYRRLPRNSGTPGWDLYQDFLRRIQERHPIQEPEDGKGRTPLPM